MKNSKTFLDNIGNNYQTMADNHINSPLKIEAFAYKCPRCGLTYRNENDCKICINSHKVGKAYNINTFKSSDDI